MHATYQFGDTFDYPFGKRQRFRDWGMWLADDPVTRRSSLRGRSPRVMWLPDDPVRAGSSRPCERE